jgi:hypothetical protein
MFQNKLKSGGENWFFWCALFDIEGVAVKKFYNGVKTIEILFLLQNLYHKTVVPNFWVMNDSIKLKILVIGESGVGKSR